MICWDNSPGDPVELPPVPARPWKRCGCCGQVLEVGIDRCEHAAYLNRRDMAEGRPPRY